MRMESPAGGSDDGGASTGPGGGAGADIAHIAHALRTAHPSGIAGGRENVARAVASDRENAARAVAAGFTTCK